MSVGHSRRTSRRAAPSTSGRSASSSCRSRSTPSFSSAAASPISCVASLNTSSRRISSLSSVLPARLRTTSVSPPSSMTVGGVIQFSGLYPPASAGTAERNGGLELGKWGCYQYSYPSGFLYTGYFTLLSSSTYSVMQAGSGRYYFSPATRKITWLSGPYKRYHYRGEYQPKGTN